jgi:hypothetical protein
MKVCWTFCRLYDRLQEERGITFAEFKGNGSISLFLVQILFACIYKTWSSTGAWQQLVAKNNKGRKHRKTFLMHFFFIAVTIIGDSELNSSS